MMRGQGEGEGAGRMSQQVAGRALVTRYLHVFGDTQDIEDCNVCTLFRQVSERSAYTTVS